MTTDPKQAAKPKVLLIEDEPALRDIYATKLRMEDFEVLEAADGVEGFDSAIQELPDVILLDVVLPMKDGFQVLQDLKRHPKTVEIPVMILSNLGQEYEVKRGLALGACCFLTKANLTPGRLVDEVRRVLAEARAKGRRAP